MVARITKGLTLLELLIAVAISMLLGGTVVLMLKTSMDAYLFSEEQALIQKILDESLEEISGESFQVYGLKDALMILEAREDALSFVPLWIDETHRVNTQKESFVLDRPFRLGSSMPFFEFRPGPKDNFSPAPIVFISRQEDDKGKTEDAVIPRDPLPLGSEVRIIFSADPEHFPDVIMRLNWDSQKKRIMRRYKNKTESVPKQPLTGIKLVGLKFQYFNNSNTEMPSPVPEDLLSEISAVKATLDLESKGQPNLRQASTFISMRNARTFGKGIIIREGMRIRIPDSSSIRAFGLGNIVGVKKGDVIQLKAQPSQGSAWRINIELDVKDNLPIVKRYAIDYPPGLTVYSETINLTCDLPFSLLGIGANGRYDYDVDKDVQNLVDLKGEVYLTVEKMTAKGAALFIRP